MHKPQTMQKGIVARRYNVSYPPRQYLFAHLKSQYQWQWIWQSMGFFRVAVENSTCVYKNNLSATKQVEKQRLMASTRPTSHIKPRLP